MKKEIKLLLVLLTVGITSCTTYDNPASYEPQYSETPEQQAFWAYFDAWKTDSCTVGDDFFMHTIGTWWKNPVAVYPNGLMTYANLVNNNRINEIASTNANLSHLSANIKNTPVMSDEEVKALVDAKFNELWAGATTREEALAAMGRAWAEGYTLLVEPVVTLEDGVPVWQLQVKTPAYLSDTELYYSKEDKWRRLAPVPSVRVTNRAAQDAMADLEVIVNAMNIGAEYMGITNDALQNMQYSLNNELSTVDGIRQGLWDAIYLLDGALVNDTCAMHYDQFVGTYFEAYNTKKNFSVTRDLIKKNVFSCMASLYALDDYNTKYISSAVRQQYENYCEEFRQAMRQRLERNQWLEDATRQNALVKLDNIVFYVGGISVIPDCVIPTLTGKDYIEDVRQLRKARLDGYRWALTQPRKTCSMLLDNLNYTEMLVADNAFYYGHRNIVCINPSNLLEPYMRYDYEYPLQLAYIATTIGHELTHGFDSDGSHFDQWGNYINWWTDNDAAKFQARCEKLVEQYNSLQLMPWVDPTLYGDGRNTLAENIADLGGCCLGLHILLDKYRDASDAEKKALMQRYFQGWAIQWSATYNLEFLKDMKVRDNHSQARERTNGVVRNINEWYDAYDVKSGTLFLPPSERVEIW